MPKRPNSYVPPAEEIQRAFSAATPGDLVFFARQCLERGGFDHALALVDALGSSADEPALALCHAVATFVGGDRERAIAGVENLLRTRPSDLNTLSVLADMRARSGDAPGAIRTLVDLVERYPDYPGAQGMLASLLMPGPGYREVLASIHRALAPRTYLEIGVESGATLALATTANLAIGVDPEDLPLDRPLRPGARVLREPSDDFFANRTRESLFGTRSVELTFIDGMHLFEFALRDFANAEAWATPGGTIVLHDCLPIAKIACERERRTRFWVGDTWKAALAIARQRPDLKIRTILTPPSGLVVVRRLDPSSRLLHERYDAIVSEFTDAEYAYEPGSWPRELAVVPSSAEGLREALA